MVLDKRHLLGGQREQLNAIVTQHGTRKVEAFVVKVVLHDVERRLVAPRFSFSSVDEKTPFPLKIFF